MLHVYSLKLFQHSRAPHWAAPRHRGCSRGREGPLGASRAAVAGAMARVAAKAARRKPSSSSFGVPLKARSLTKVQSPNEAACPKASAPLKRPAPSAAFKTQLRSQTRLSLVADDSNAATSKGSASSQAKPKAGSPAVVAKPAAKGCPKPAAAVAGIWKALGAATAKRHCVRSEAEAKAKPKAATTRTSAGSSPRSSTSVGASTGNSFPSQQDGRFEKLQIPLLSPKSATAITVAFEDIEKKLRGVLEKYGTAIVTGVASPEECKTLETKFVADLAELIDMPTAEKAGFWGGEAARAAAEDAKHWPVQSLSLLGPMERCQSRGLPHGRFAWAARLLPRVRKVYAIVHGTDDLVSSCDNSFFAPPMHSKQKTNRLFPHVDQNAHDDRFRDQLGHGVNKWDVFQGVLYVWDCASEHSSTTVVWPGSHKAVYERVMADEKVQRAGKQGRHFTLINGVADRERAARLMSGWREGARRLPAPAGALVLWSGRTVHQGWRGGPRLAQPVCWEPAARRPAAARERKLRLAALGLPSTHWASLGLPHMLLGSGPEKDEPSKETNRVKGGWELPVVASLQPRPLVDNVVVADMWKKLQAAPWDKPLPTALAALLERSIRAEFKKVL